MDLSNALQVSDLRKVVSFLQFTASRGSENNSEMF